MKGKMADYAFQKKSGLLLEKHRDFFLKTSGLFPKTSGLFWKCLPRWMKSIAVKSQRATHKRKKKHPRTDISAVFFVYVVFLLYLCID